jgi:putative sigma-54 modulation protein
MISMRGIQIYADAIDQDMYAAIDGLADKLDRQVRKHKEKNSDHHARDVDKSVYE